MPTSAQIRGMLLEEALLFLLRRSGYRTVETVGTDDTLQRGSAGLEVKGRGGVHQIDAISEFFITPPFSYPHRLLIEAKCYEQSHQKVGIEIVRNAVGVYKDVAEYWLSRGIDITTKNRYHYQYAVFSSTGYTKPAQNYAFAQDIYLIPLERSPNIRPIIEEIMSIGGTITIKELKSLRMAVRNTLKFTNNSLGNHLNENDRYFDRLADLINACRRVNSALLAVLDKRFPVFLVPNPNVVIHQLPDLIYSRIYWDEHGWYLHSTTDNRELFTFDIPREMLDQYTEGKILHSDRALDLKEERLAEIQAIVTENDSIRLITFRLDQQWINGIRKRINQKKPDRE